MKHRKLNENKIIKRSQCYINHENFSKVYKNEKHVITKTFFLVIPV